MSTILSILNTLNWAAAEILNRPTQNVAGAYQEPALTNANLVMSTILAPPFAWQWNRAVQTQAISKGTSDYLISLPNFGWLEKATITYVTPPPSGNTTVEIEITTLSALSGKSNRPFKICPVFDDNAGNITFRLFPIPDQAYTLTLTYQNAPILATSLTSNSFALTATQNASNGTTTYIGTPINPPNPVGSYFLVTGFPTTLGSNPYFPNNGLFLCTATTGSSITLQNPNGQAVSANATCALATTWAPIPDKYNFLYERGMLSLLHKIYDHSAYLAEMQMFYRSLVGCSEGLSESAKAIFLEDRLSQLRTQQYVANATTAGPKRAQ